MKRLELPNSITFPLGQLTLAKCALSATAILKLLKGQNQQVSMVHYNA